MFNQEEIDENTLYNLTYEELTTLELNDYYISKMKHDEIDSIIKSNKDVPYNMYKCINTREYNVFINTKNDEDDIFKVEFIISIDIEFKKEDYMYRCEHIVNNLKKFKKDDEYYIKFFNFINNYKE